MPKPVGTPWEARLAPADAPLPDNKFLKILEGKAPAEVVDSDDTDDTNERVTSKAVRGAIPFKKRPSDRRPLLLPL